MPAPIYDPQQLSALARILAEAALEQLILDAAAEKLHDKTETTPLETIE
jgi:hypothetical protein